MNASLVSFFVFGSGLLLAGGCSTSDDPDETTPEVDASAPGPSDASAPSPTDAAAPGPSDAEAPALDAGLPDAAVSEAGTSPDAALSEAGSLPDAGFSDAGMLPDSAIDSSVPAKVVLDLNDVQTNPDAYDWQDFRPNVLKLFLAGAAETEHIAILWYTVSDGAVGLHYHSMTESVYVIEGTQTDAQGVYETGTAYFNPPGSGHEISNSSGFFILAYAAPPDFMNTDAIEAYTPVKIDTTDPELMSEYEFEAAGPGTSIYDVPLVADGGLSAQLIEVTSADALYEFTGNYLVVLEGSCVIDGQTLADDFLVVTSDVAPLPFTVGGPEAGTCLAMGVSF
jgi:hypothetical protein